MIVPSDLSSIVCTRGTDVACNSETGIRLPVLCTSYHSVVSCMTKIGLKRTIVNAFDRENSFFCGCKVWV